MLDFALNKLGISEIEKLNTVLTLIIAFCAIYVAEAFIIPNLRGKKWINAKLGAAVAVLLSYSVNGKRWWPLQFKTPVSVITFPKGCCRG